MIFNVSDFDKGEKEFLHSLVILINCNRQVSFALIAIDMFEEKTMRTSSFLYIFFVLLLVLSPRQNMH